MLSKGMKWQGMVAIGLALAQPATRAWATRWFADAKAPTPTITPRPVSNYTAKNATWFRSAEPGLLAAIDVQMLHNLGRALIRVENSLQKTNTADQQLFRGLGAACFEDFLRGAAQTLLLSPRVSAADSPPSPAEHLRFSACVSDIVFDLNIDETVAAIARKTMVAEAPARPALHSRAQAIRAQNIKIGAMIGTSQLKLVDFYALETGDVVVLDRGADDEVSLTVDGLASTGVAGIVFSEDADLKLRITQLEGLS